MIKKKKIILLICAFILIALLGVSYQQYGLYQQRSLYPPVGKMMSVNGHAMHIIANGSASLTGTLVMTAGSGTTTPYADFYPIMPGLQQHGRVVLYERPGYGWSEAADTPRDVDTIAEELHHLLAASGELPPYILLGHSMGALEIIRFAQLYPEEVAGLIFLDGTSPQYARDFSTNWVADIGWNAIATAKHIGLLRALSDMNLINGMFVDIDDLPEELKKLKIIMALRNANNPDMKEERQRLNENGLAVLRGGSLGDLAILVLSAPNNGYPNWANTQNELIQLSNNSQQIKFEQAGHYIHHDAPDKVISSIASFITSLQ
ncbi:alpha/beta hydrolase [Paenibacillus alvei TS-15]|uniref:Alpha/beta hydrolase n=1 Tax=Paenibacillus alvei TS-15 TaxID=1117108 RepID=S9SJ85_PAEAL|nr:alpha/beta hydrolase [Paenibacillus alvei]EPY04113.1 alpha/beta hydrolase [Paenibacillus alvei TS-15]